MTFPVLIPLPWGGTLHPHVVFDVLAYTGGFQLYLLLARRSRGDALGGERRLWVVAGAVVGAAIGAKLLALAERPDLGLAALGGKTVVGGLLGGWAGVEIAKRLAGVARSTGDLMVFPLIVGMALGRVGCFLTGLDDGTQGTATDLPWGVDYGDGVPRHPAPLYEVAFLAVLGVTLALDRKARPAGARFRLFLLGYLAFRIASEFYKPRPFTYGPASAIQLACVAGVGACLWGLCRAGTPARGRDGTVGQV